ncbi:MAG: c-type cytochrome biogenesis protein CcsB [Azoarcus sp.]|jgi:cytochrome c biogenesis protein|nr:c-type cytochrome biogenesis protein CcsB [Azoarcus sp.]
MQRRPNARSSTLEAAIELLSSMRFAISLLTVLAIASIIGSVVQQNEPANAYLNQFGQFWDPVFARLGLYSVYNAGWFVAILAFLVLSTTLCIVRQLTPMLHEMRGFREQAREASLRAFSHNASLTPTLPPQARRGAVTDYLRGAGFRLRANEREDGVLIAAKRGSAGRIGYFLAHGAIVLICIGSLLDGNLPLGLQLSLSGKAPTSGGQPSTNIPESAELGPETWSYRGNVYIPEGGSADSAVLNAGDGILLQRLPFKIELNRFNIDYYPTGMPKRYASDVTIVGEDGQRIERTLEVNKPFEYQGVTLFQSGFDDGGSILDFTLHDFAPGAGHSEPFKLKVGNRLPFGNGYALELIAFRPNNVENIAAPNATAGKFTGSGAGAQDEKNLRNFGPSYTYRLRDKAGQAREFFNYMLPLTLDGREYLVSGVRASQAQPYSYIRIPLDEKGSAATWFAIRQLLLDPERRGALTAHFIARNLDAKDQALHERLKSMTEHTLALFGKGALEGVSDFIQQTVPEAEREETGAIFIQILQGLTWDAWTMTREAAGQPTLEPDSVHTPFIRDALFALNDSIRYGLPFYLQLNEFEHRQATILQATRSPGKPLVYFGSLLLVLGVFALLYIRERRLFVLLKDDEALVAMSSNRKTLELGEQFALHRDGLAAVLGGPPSANADAPAAATDAPRAAVSAAPGNWLTKRTFTDWLYALALVAGAVIALLHYGRVMDGYEQAILVLHIPILAAIGWAWRPFRPFAFAVATLALASIWLYQGDLARANQVFFLKYLISSQTAVSWMSAFFFLATAVYWFGLASGSSFARRSGSRLTWIASVMGAVGLFVRWYESYLLGPEIGHIPISNLYEVFVLFSLISALLYLFYEDRYDTGKMGAFVLLVISVAVGFLLWYSFTREAYQIQPLVPALQSYWMKIHVPANFVGYGGFALAAMVGIAYLLVERGVLVSRLPAPNVLEDAMYKAISIGFAFFTIATILGALWAAAAWGSYWSWDPKETWALIVWLNYAIWLHMRLTRELRGRLLAWWAVVGLFVVTFAFVGVNMFLTGLHSYGSL